MPQTTTNKQNFSQRHPFVFGFGLIVVAAVLLVGTAAALRYALFGSNGSGSFFSGDALGVVHLDGMILESATVGDWIDTLERDEKIKGVLLRINSPGGGVTPSQELHRAVARLAASKPVVVSMGTVAASGGYYAASPARLIYANPSTLTGSIGVKMELTNFEGLMDKIGVGHESLASGRLKDAVSPYKPLSDESRAYLKAMVMDMYDQFVDDVAKDRKLDRAALEGFADGRALTGRQAQKLGLVDKLGDMTDALNALRELAGVDQDARLVEGPPKERNWLREALSSMLSLRPAGRWNELAAPDWQFYYL